MWLALACGIISGIGLAILGYYAGKENWLGRDRQTTAPVRHRMQEIDTAQIVTACLLDEAERAGVPLPNTNGVTTKVTNTRRKT